MRMKSWFFVFLVLFSSAFCSELKHKTRSKGVKVDSSEFESEDILAEARGEDVLAEARAVYESILAICQKKYPRGPSYLGAYNITNWPINISPRYGKWNKTHINQLRQALPKMSCAPSPRDGATGGLHIKARRRLLLDALVKKFKKDTCMPGDRVLWSKCNIFGWPKGIDCKRIDRFTCEELETAFKSLDNIKFVLAEEGEEAIVTDKPYSGKTFTVVKKRQRREKRSESTTISYSNLDGVLEDDMKECTEKDSPNTTVPLIVDSLFESDFVFDSEDVEDDLAITYDFDFETDLGLLSDSGSSPETINDFTDFAKIFA